MYDRLAASSGYAAPMIATTVGTSSASVGSRRPSSQAWRTARRRMRRSTKPRPSLPGRCRRAAESSPPGRDRRGRGTTCRSPAGPPGYRAPTRCSTRAISGRKRSVWKMSIWSCITAAMRSRPAPVSTLGFGSGASVPSGAVELHEHQVPDLEEPPRLGQRFEMLRGRAVPVRCPASIPGRRRSRSTVRTVRCRPSARSCPCRRGRRSGRAAGRRSRARGPRASRSFVMHGDAQPIGSQAEPLLRGDEFPRERDRVALEVIAEGEVAEHLEERVVPPGQPDLLEVVVLAPGADALLARRRAAVGSRILPEEGPLELDHAGVGEQQRRVVPRFERRRGDLDVPVCDEEIEEFPADACGFHGGKLTARARGPGGSRAPGRTPEAIPAKRLTLEAPGRRADAFPCRDSRAAPR